MTRTMRTLLRPGLFVVAVACVVGLVLASGIVLAGHSTRTSSPPGVGSNTVHPALPGLQGALPGTIHAHDFTLSDQYGHPVSLRDYRGSVVILALLSSTCGPTCVLLAQQIRGALDELPHPVPVLLVSVDPAGDTRARVSDFLAQASLTGRVQYLSGSPTELRGVWQAYGALTGTSASAGATNDEGAVRAGAAAVVLVDPDGLERAVLPIEQLTPEALSGDVRRLQSGGPSRSALTGAEGPALIP